MTVQNMNGHLLELLAGDKMNTYTFIITLNFPSTDFQIKPEYMWLGIASNRLLYFL